MIGALNNAATGLSLPPARSEQARETVVHDGREASRTAESEPAAGNASLAAPITGSPVNAVPPVETSEETAPADRQHAEQSYQAANRIANDTVTPPENLLDVLR